MSDEPCNHRVANISGEDVHEDNYPAVVSEWEAAVELFNSPKTRIALPHPGHCLPFAYCPDCGSLIRWKRIREIPLKKFNGVPRVYSLYADRLKDLI